MALCSTPCFSARSLAEAVPVVAAFGGHGLGTCARAPVETAVMEISVARTATDRSFVISHLRGPGLQLASSRKVARRSLNLRVARASPPCQLPIALDGTMSFDLGKRPALGYTDNPVDRLSQRRHDAAYLATLESDHAARAYAVGGELILLKKTANGLDPLFTLDAARALAPPVETVFLGVLDGVPRFGIGLDLGGAEAVKMRDDLHVTDLRS